MALKWVVCDIVTTYYKHLISWMSQLGFHESKNSSPGVTSTHLILDELWRIEGIIPHKLLVGMMGSGWWFEPL